MARNFMLLYGKKSVHERLRANPASVRHIFLEEDMNIPSLEKLAQEHHIPLERVPARKIENMKRAKNVQGVVARVDRFFYTPFDNLISSPSGEMPVLLFLDRVNDPQNLGVIIRTLACFGGFAVVIPSKGACEVTEAVLHVACGGENYIRVSKVDGMDNAIATAKKCGFWIIGGVVQGGESVYSVKMKFPLGLVLGAETEGISPELERHIDTNVCIPMPGAGLSLNVAMASAIFSYEILRQRAAGK